MARRSEALWERDSLRPVPGFLRPIDTGKLANELRLSQLGSERGSKNLPSTDGQMPDSVEQTVTQHLESVWAWNGGVLLNHLRAYAGRIETYSMESEFAKLKIEASDALAELRSADHRAEAELGPLREQLLGTKAELEDFRRSNELVRIARSPARRWTTVGLIFVLVALESVVNGVFFAKGSAFGLIGGVGTAIGISIVNIVFAFLLGLWPARWINHKSYFAKVTGAFVVSTGLAALIILHGFAAHLREASAKLGEEQSFAHALHTLKTSPLALNDLNSFYLFGLGVLFALWAAWKGYNFDDPYPGYGAVFRRFDKAREEYSGAHDELFEDLLDIKSETLAKLRDGITRLPTFPQILTNLRAQRHSMVEQFRAFEENILAATRQLLAIYRDANIDTRTSPPPSYFSIQYELPSSFLSSPEAVALMTEQSRIPIEVNSALDALNELSQEILTEYERLFGTYPHPTQMMANSDGKTASKS